jgi:hypothetical protein
MQKFSTEICFPRPLTAKERWFLKQSEKDLCPVEIEYAIRWFGRLQKSKRIYRGMTSYAIKGMVERVMEVPGGCVSTASLIFAAIAFGFRVEFSPSLTTAFFNIRPKSLSEAWREYATFYERPRNCKGSLSMFDFS